MFRAKSNLIAVALTCTLLFSSFRTPRAWLIHPLYVHQPEVAAEFAYVMSGGPASFERLIAASDLYHTKKISYVALAIENQPSGYNYTTHQSGTRSDRCIAYLIMKGVPRERIKLIPMHASSRFGSLREAKSVAKELQKIERLVVITSAAHTRRTQIAFMRSLPESTSLQIYAASDPLDSDEIFSPLWIEYLKLMVYSVVA